MSALAVVIPHVDYKGLSPLIAVASGSMLVLMLGLFRPRVMQVVVVPVAAIASLAVAIGLTIWIWKPGPQKAIASGSFSVDTLTLGLSILFYVSGIVAVLLAARGRTVRATGGGEIFGLILGSVTGMVVLAGASSLVVLFVGIELLSIPLYVLCGSRIRHERSLEAGLKYLVIGSVGSATLLYGLALVYGATGTTSFAGITARIGNGTTHELIGAAVSPGDPLLLTGIAMAMVGLAFKASVAPFHQWTPDVYQGAPTPVTAFMAVATKAAAFAVIIRFFDKMLLPKTDDWVPAMAALAVVTIVVGNVGAIGARSLKRMLGWSGVAQAGYMLAGVVVGTQLGVQATAFYLAAYVAMNMAAFAVVVARERVSEAGDDLASFEGLGRAAPWLAWPLTIAMLALAGFPATAGFIGKFFLIRATVEGGYTWLGVVIVVGSMISLVYYLRVIAVMWMTPVDVELPTVPRRRVPRVAGWSPEADAGSQPIVLFVAVLAAAATIAIGIWPDPLFHAARDVGSAIAGLG